MFKTCAECGLSKLLIDFYAKSRKSVYPGKAGVSHRCKECDKKGRSAYVDENVDKVNASDRKYHLSKYGLTPEDYNSMFQQQNGECAGCSRHQSEFNRRLVIDHDHSTGKIRGLLCVSCNLILGWAKDKQSTLENLIEYLKSSELADSKSNVVELNSTKKVG